MPFWIDFCSIFDPNFPPQIHQNRSKIDAKMPSHVELLFWSIFDRFLLPTWIPRIRQIMVFPKEKQWFFENPLFANHIDFWSIWVPTWLHFGSQKPSKSFQKSIPRCIKFLIDFCIDFGLDWIGLDWSRYYNSTSPNAATPPTQRGGSHWADRDGSRLVRPLTCTPRIHNRVLSGGRKARSGRQSSGTITRQRTRAHWQMRYRA